MQNFDSLPNDRKMRWINILVAFLFDESLNENGERGRLVFPIYFFLQHRYPRAAKLITFVAARCAIAGPCIHERAPSFKRIPAAVGPLDRIASRVRQVLFGKLTGI
jgi:hypothetical protein